MPPPSSLVSRLKVQLKLSISRLRNVQQKDTALAKQQRRDMAQLLEQGKVESARIRVENIIRSDIATELHEILELYCELLLARSQLLDPPSPSASLNLHSSSSSSNSQPIQCDPGLEEPVRSLIYAAPRTEVKELHSVRNLLVDRFGKDFALSAMEGEGVADRVLKKLKIETPSRALVDSYLSLIASTYGVDWPGQPETADDDEDEDDEGGGGGQKVEQGTKELEPALEAEPEPKDAKAADSEAGKKGDAAKMKREDSAKLRKDDEVAALSRATPPRALGPASPIRVAPPSPSTENVVPKLRLPGANEKKGGKKEEVKKPAPAEAAKNKKKDDGPGGKIPDIDALQKRFAQLKR